MKEIYFNTRKHDSITRIPTNIAENINTRKGLFNKVTGKNLNLEEFQKLKNPKEQIITFLKDDWKGNEAFKRTTFERYIEFTDSDVFLKEMEELTIQYEKWSGETFHLHPDNDDFNNWLKSNHLSLYEKRNPKMTHIPALSMIEISNDGYRINFSKGYCTLQANKQQLAKIVAVKEVIETFKTHFKLLKVENALYGTSLENSTAFNLKKLLRPYVKHISQDLSKIEFNYNEILMEG